MQPQASLSTSAPVHPLRALREARGLSLRQLGRRSTIDYRELWRIEMRGLRPTALQRRLLAAALNVSIRNFE
jgi:transcriptional regulator with XRE-family HTH domain